MDLFGNLPQGFAVALTPQNLLYGAIGVLLGIGPALTVLLPVTAKIDSTGAFIMFAGIFYGKDVRHLRHGPHPGRFAWPRSAGAGTLPGRAWAGGDRGAAGLASPG